LSPALIIPLGSTEQHGPHLPLDTDTRIATAVARVVAGRLAGDWMLAPAVGYGASGEHE
jgi:creatinine amidohydrolase/Fe(II)-dependent formamide hydrolase-like protein